MVRHTFKLRTKRGLRGGANTIDAIVIPVGVSEPFDYFAAWRRNAWSLYEEDQEEALEQKMIRLDRNNNVIMKEYIVDGEREVKPLILDYIVRKKPRRNHGKELKGTAFISNIALIVLGENINPENQLGEAELVSVMIGGEFNDSLANPASEHFIHTSLLIDHLYQPRRLVLRKKVNKQTNEATYTWTRNSRLRALRPDDPKIDVVEAIQNFITPLAGLADVIIWVLQDDGTYKPDYSAVVLSEVDLMNFNENEDGTNVLVVEDDSLELPEDIEAGDDDEDENTGDPQVRCPVYKLLYETLIENQVYLDSKLFICGRPDQYLLRDDDRQPLKDEDGNETGEMSNPRILTWGVHALEDYLVLPPDSGEIHPEDDMLVDEEFLGSTKRSSPSRVDNDFELDGTEDENWDDSL
jgi:hypothetical protein